MSEHKRGKASPCNKVLLKQLRESRGFTQLELAKLSGYSDRLVIKAEAGQSVSWQAIEDIAEALSSETQTIYAEDLVSYPLELAQQYMESVYRYQKQTLQHIQHFLAEDLYFQVSGDSQQIPFAGIYHGHEGFQQLMDSFFSVVEVPVGHDPRPHYQYFGQGLNVIIWGRSWIHPIGYPMPEPISISNLLRFRQGKIYYIDDHFDTQYGAEVIAKSKDLAQTWLELTTSRSGEEA